MKGERGTGAVCALVARKGKANHSVQQVNEELEEYARRLSASGDYRVLRRLQPQTHYRSCPDASLVRRALMVDVETTGLVHATDCIIELGIMLFTYNARTGHILQVLAAESWLQDPGRPIPENIVKLTGITDRDVRGQQIDEKRVRELAAGVALVIAHNASFDRPFVDKRLPFLADIHWGCSMADVPWHTMNKSSLKLDHLLYTHTSTFLDTHHRALDDCRATLHVLATPFSSDARTPMELLLANCRTQRVRVLAVRALYESKDLLKQRGYQFSGDAGKPPKTWCREIPSCDADAEVQWLRDHVYAGPGGQPVVEKVDLKRRYCAG